MKTFTLGLMRVVAVLAVVLLVVVLIGSIFSAHFVFATINYVVENLASRSGLSPFLVRGIVILATLPFFWAVAVFTRNFIGLMNLGWNPLALYKKSSGIIIIGYVGLFYCAMYWASRDAYAYKYCGDTPEHIFVSDGPGKDPIYGVALKPCTLDQVKELRSREGALGSPLELHVQDADAFEWFDGVTGKPRVWYAVRPNGDYRLFDRSGIDPHSGQTLKPITTSIIERIKQRQAAQLAEENEKNAKQLADAAKAQEEVDMQALITQAQSHFDMGDYKGAKETCDQVLAHQAGFEPCATIHQRASAKLSEGLVQQGLSEFQKGEFQEALWSADGAIKLDPKNSTAIKLKQLVSQMKPRQPN